jgi:hypothetical protein
MLSVVDMLNLCSKNCRPIRSIHSFETVTLEPQAVGVDQPKGIELLARSTIALLSARRDQAADICQPESSDGSSLHRRRLQSESRWHILLTCTTAETPQTLQTPMKVGLEKALRDDDFAAEISIPKFEPVNKTQKKKTRKSEKHNVLSYHVIFDSSVHLTAWKQIRKDAWKKSNILVLAVAGCQVDVETLKAGPPVTKESGLMGLVNRLKKFFDRSKEVAGTIDNLHGKAEEGANEANGTIMCKNAIHLIRVWIGSERSASITRRGVPPQVTPRRYQRTKRVAGSV